MDTNIRLSAFGGLTMFAASVHQHNIYRMAQETADANGAPVEIWERDGWLVISEDPEPDDAFLGGWRSLAVVVPQEVA